LHIKNEEEKFNRARLAQQNGFGPAFLQSSEFAEASKRPNKA
jgi:hypothetical protein